MFQKYKILKYLIGMNHVYLSRIRLWIKSLGMPFQIACEA